MTAVLRVLLLLAKGFLLSAQLLKDRALECSSDKFDLKLNFVDQFHGVVFADKYYMNPECRWEGDGSTSLNVVLHLETDPGSPSFCGIETTKKLAEFGLTLIISPMKGLLVDGVEGLTIRCAYNTDSITLTLPTGANGPGILISQRTYADVVTGSGGSPFLKMVIREGHGTTGNIIDSAQVGQPITLDVIMEDTTIYDFYVHDCYAHDGSNTPEASISIIDKNGCGQKLPRAVEGPVFTTVQPGTGSKHVYINLYGFQFTTSQLVYFQCHVRPCLQSCNRPQCQAADERKLMQRRSPPQFKVLPSSSKAKDVYNLTTVIRIIPQEVEAVMPFAITDVKSGAEVANRVCMNSSLSIVSLGAFVCIALLSLVVTVCLCHRLKQTSADEQSSFSTPSSLRRLRS